MMKPPKSMAKRLSSQVRPVSQITSRPVSMAAVVQASLSRWVPLAWPPWPGNGSSAPGRAGPGPSAGSAVPAARVSRMPSPVVQVVRVQPGPGAPGDDEASCQVTSGSPSPALMNSTLPCRTDVRGRARRQNKDWGERTRPPCSRCSSASLRMVLLCVSFQARNFTAISSTLATTTACKRMSLRASAMAPKGNRAD